MKSILIAVILLFSGVANAQEYGLLLQKHVKPSQKQGISVNLVDYKAWAQDELHEKAMSKLLAAKPKSLGGNEKLVFWINAYNLLTIDLIIKTGETQSIRNQGTLVQNVWKKHKWTIDGGQYSLDAIEHQILRNMNEPRIHFAIVCASLSCPDLRVKPYTAANIDKELEDATMSFLKDKTKGVKFVNENLVVSHIFNWFEQDFGGKAAVKTFISKRLNINESVEFKGNITYNWNLNGL